MPTPAPAPSGDAAAAVAFAAAQLGDAYRWGAAGPDSWDCSGLMMMAWRAGGISLPHSSAGQYAASTPIGAGDLRPGDLVFWGASPSGIYHVAMYVGGGEIIHAPAHRPAGQPRVDVLLDGSGLLRPSLTAALGHPRLWNAPPPLDATEASSVA